MSSVDTIEVPEDLPEGHVFELNRIMDLDVKHGQLHKSAGAVDSCSMCWCYINAARGIAEGRSTPMIEATQTVARKLAEQLQEDSCIDAHPADFWDLALRPEARRKFRKHAVEIILALQLDLSILPNEER